MAHRRLSHTAFDLLSHQAQLAFRFQSWALARSERLDFARQMSVLRCEYYERPDWETGSSGAPVCRFSHGPTDEWCEPCRQRHEMYQGRFYLLRKIEREHFRLLCAMAERRVRAGRSHQKRA